MLIKKLAGLAIVIAVVGSVSLISYGIANKPAPQPTKAGSPATNTAAPQSAQTTTPSDVAPPPAETPTPTPSPTVYCIGRSPCYSPLDVSRHSKKGDCWGWNKDVVINVSEFSKSYHRNKSGVDIEVASVCGQDLSKSLGGHVDIDGLTRNHEPATKNNQNSKVTPYFVGYFDADKP